MTKSALTDPQSNFFIRNPRAKTCATSHKITQA